MIKAIIFDMDDLMIDSESFHFNSYREVLGGFGVSLTLRHYVSYCLGISDKDICKVLLENFNIPVAKNELLRLKNKVFRKKYMRKITPKKGLFSLLKNLKNKKYSLAVASGSQIEEIKEITQNLKIHHFFDTIVSADFVKHGKPAPDIFLFTAEKMNKNPEECLVLEDSLSGLIAAKKAQMKCYVIPNRTKDKDFSSADKILDSLDDVYENIGK